VILIVDYGIGNLRSAEKALQHSGVDARLVNDPRDLVSATAVVLPGVGSFGTCVAALDASGWREPIVEALDAGMPFLGICVGFQMLFEGSDESPDARGLGVVSGRVRKLEEAPKLPHIQWNRLDIVRSSLLLPEELDEQWMYFVHSYAAPVTAETVATATYGSTFSAAIARDNILGVQFHPEKSGSQGLALLARFAEMTGAN
jgi:imidazole glycerol-phosphate synthase subunit HisH